MTNFKSITKILIFKFRHLNIWILTFGFITFALFFSAKAASAATYYVATNGSDANPGTITQPFRTIVKSNSVLQPGDTLYIRGGTYDEGFNIAQAKSGTASQSVTIAGYPGETALVYSFPLCFYNCAGASAGASYIVLDNLIFDGQRYGTSGAYFGYGGNTFAPHHITLKNSTVRNHWGGQGIQVAGSYHTFSNLKVHDIGKDTFDHGFYIDRADHVTVENSEIYNIKSAGIKFGETAMNYGIARNNIIHDFGLGQEATSASTQGGGTGFSISIGATNIMIYNNIIYNNKSPATCNNCPGIQLWKGDRNKVYNNVVYNMGPHQGIMVSHMTNVDVTNNIVTESTPNFKNEGFGGTWTLGNNLCDVSGPGCSIVGYPKFINPAGNDFHLQSTSPAINAGATLSEVTTDFDGILRPQGSGYDIGAYEYVGSPPAGASADLNSDGRVNSVDAAILMGAWGQTTKPKADINQDGAVNSVDASLMMGQWSP